METEASQLVCVPVTPYYLLNEVKKVVGGGGN